MFDNVAAGKCMSCDGFYMEQQQGQPFVVVPMKIFGSEAVIKESLLSKLLLPYEGGGACSSCVRPHVIYVRWPPPARIGQGHGWQYVIIGMEWDAESAPSRIVYVQS